MTIDSIKCRSFTFASNDNASTTAHFLTLAKEDSLRTETS